MMAVSTQVLLSPLLGVRTNNNLKEIKEIVETQILGSSAYNLYLHVKTFCWLYLSLIHLIIYIQDFRNAKKKKMSGKKKKKKELAQNRIYTSSFFDMFTQKIEYILALANSSDTRCDDPFFIFFFLETYKRIFTVAQLHVAQPIYDTCPITCT